MAKSSVLKFALPATGDLKSIMEQARQYRPGGKILLNKTEWRGKEPRSCGITNVKSRPHRFGEPTILDIEVSYRPKGYINYVGQSRYDGWDFAPLERTGDGQLLDSQGQPLEEGQPRVYGCHHVYGDIEFGDLEFGEYVGEFSVEEVGRTTTEEILSEISQGGWSVGEANFVAPRRSRPYKKIILSNAPTADGIDGFGTQIRNISFSTPHLEDVLMDELTQLMHDYIEGRVAIKSHGNDQVTFVELSGALVDCSPNEHGLDSFFDVLQMYTPVTFMEELGKRLKATYAIDIAIVEGNHAGFALRRDFSKS